MATFTIYNSFTMKILTAFYGCLFLCSLFCFFSCTKNNKEVSEPATQNNTSKALSNASGATIAGFMPGDSLVIKGNASNGDETALLQTYAPDTNRIDFPSFVALGRQLSGNFGLDRSILRFGLRHISDSLLNNPSQIQKAVLYLYQYSRPADQDPYVVKQSAVNGAELHRIVGDWENSTVSGNNQPARANGSVNPLEDVVMIAPVKTPLRAGTNDNQVLDVTDMVRKMFANGKNEGFYLRLTGQGEANNAYCGRAYGSVACPIISKRPKLVLYF